MIHKNDFLNGLSKTINGVAIATVKHQNAYFGLTISSFVSISADPPIIQIAINKKTIFYDKIKQSSQFVLNILSQNDVQWAQKFSGRAATDNYQFNNEWIMDPCPILQNCLVSLMCEKHQQIDIATHGLFLGLANQIAISPDKDLKPLAYWQRNYYNF